jgi:PKD domain
VKKLAILAVAVAMVAAGIGFSTKGASAAPVVNTGGPYAAAVGQAIQFNGSASSGVGIVSFVWNFGDGTSATGATPVKSYAAAGVYTVTLTVTDATGSASATTTATISGVAPSAGCVLTNLGVICNPVSLIRVVPVGCILTPFGLSCPRVVVASSVVSTIDDRTYTVSRAGSCVIIDPLTLRPIAVC